jgi:hypothetical protein
MVRQDLRASRKLIISLDRHGTQSEGIGQAYGQGLPRRDIHPRQEYPHAGEAASPHRVGTLLIGAMWGA